MSNAPRIVLRPNPSVTTEQTRDARARAWAYVFDCWHTRRGDPHDLMNGSTAEMAKHGPRKTEQENT